MTEHVKPHVKPVDKLVSCSVVFCLFVYLMKIFFCVFSLNADSVFSFWFNCNIVTLHIKVIVETTSRRRQCRAGLDSDNKLH